ncbi:MAG TPA: bifunctional phosphoglucose/phosphomannose isomerase [Candidatus Saccharimonadales bacterium]|nr:bifunctional phosphoglucose/phosphomannose isomerase [Candidatus Saccharimonadales bacterium]
MLDDLKMIHDRDAQDALGVAEKQWQQLQHIYQVDLSRFHDVWNVVLAGMGGSALPGVFLRSWPGTNVPFEIVRDYEVPTYVGTNTLFISSSYSGNTEETLSALAAAEERGAQIVVIAAGGKLAELAKQKQYPLFEVPSGIQPRMSSGYFLAAFVQLLEPLGLVPAGSRDELAATATWLSEKPAAWRADVPTAQNPAKQMALEVIGKSVVVYGGPKLFPAANKLKICFNENAKNVAWVNQYSEFNHNEFIGWTSHPVDKPYAVIEIRSNLEHPRIQKRFEVSERLLSGQRPAPLVIKPEGETLLQQLLWSANFGDFVSLYTALLNGLNPTPVDLVEKLKVELDR